MAVEPLEQRVLLAIDTLIQPASPAYDDLAALTGGTVPANLTEGDVRFEIGDDAADKLYDVDTVFDPVDGLRAVLRMADGASPQEKGLTQFPVVLHAGPELAVAYDLAVLLPDHRMVDAMHADRAASAQAIVYGAGQTMIDGQPLAPDSGSTESSADADDKSIDQKLDEIAALARTAAENFLGPTDPQSRLGLYEDLRKLSADLDAAKLRAAAPPTPGHQPTQPPPDGSAAGTLAEESVVEEPILDPATLADYAHRLGATAYVLAGRMKLDASTGGAALADAAREALDAAYSQSDLYFKGWTGEGVNSDLYRTERTDLGTRQYSVWYEAGQASLTDQFAIDLGREALLQLSVPLDHDSSGRLRTANQSTNRPAVEGTFVEGGIYANTPYDQFQPPFTGMHVTDYGSEQMESYIQFDLNQFALTSQEVTSANLQLFVPNPIYGSPVNAATVVPNYTWNTGLTYANRPTGLAQPAATWQPHAAFNYVDISDAVRRELRVGDMDFSFGLQAANPGVTPPDFVEFENYVRTPTAYHDQYDIQTAIADNPATPELEDILYRGDANFNGVIDGDDTGLFLRRLGKRHGDFDFDCVRRYLGRQHDLGQLGYRRRSRSRLPRRRREPRYQGGHLRHQRRLRKLGHVQSKPNAARDPDAHAHAATVRDDHQQQHLDGLPVRRRDLVPGKPDDQPNARPGDQGLCQRRHGSDGHLHRHARGGAGV